MLVSKLIVFCFPNYFNFKYNAFAEDIVKEKYVGWKQRDDMADVTIYF